LSGTGIPPAVSLNPGWRFVMKKLRLNSDEIRVVGFEVTSSEGARQGTVMAREDMPTGFLCPTNGEDPTCRLGSCYSGSPCSYCP
jgi:hypothetical protein